MYYVPKSKMYQGPKFKKYLAFFGFFIGFLLIIFLVTLNPLIEWILTMLVAFWIMITAIQCIVYKFFNIDDERSGSSTGPNNIEVPSLTSIKELMYSAEPQIAPATQSFFPFTNLVRL